MTNICVIGLGFIGVPIADACARKGYTTFGVDINKETVDAVNRGINPSSGEDISGDIKATTDYSVIENSDIVLICLPTPMKEDGDPDLSILRIVAEQISAYVSKNQLYILESTVYPGVTEELLIPKLEKGGFRAGKDFWMAYCPERITLGSEKWVLENIPRVVGACSDIGLNKTMEFYEDILDTDIMAMSSIRTAEAVKVFENAFRDVNIAFVNELAKVFDKSNIDFYEVIRGAATKPFGFMPFYPGPGVGGTCIPMCASSLAGWAEKEGSQTELIRKARKINNTMPKYTVTLLLSGLKEAGLEIEGVRIGILGVSYKGGIGDVRDSPSFDVIDNLKKLGANILVFDPYLPEESTVESLDEISQCDCLVLLTNHPEFKNVELKNAEVLIDTKDFFNQDEIRSQGIVYRGVGKGTGQDISS